VLGAKRVSGVMQSISMKVGGDTMPTVEGRGSGTYLTRFCVQSRSRLTSLAAFMPSAKLARVPFRRRCASACNSSNSRCLALSAPELYASSQSPCHLHLASQRRRGREIYVCACVAKPRSSGRGLKAPFKRSLSISTRSTPLPWPAAEEDSYSPLALPL